MRVRPTATRAQLRVPTPQSTLRLRGGPLRARPANALYVPKASCKYFCPTSFRYSSIALVASVFSLKMRCSFSPQRSTSDIIRSVKKSWKAKPMVGHHALTRASFRRAGSLPFPLFLQPHGDKRREKSLESRNFCTPKNDSFQACTTSAPPSVLVFGWVSYQPHVLWVKHFLLYQPCFLWVKHFLCCETGCFWRLAALVANRERAEMPRAAPPADGCEPSPYDAARCSDILFS